MPTVVTIRSISILLTYIMYNPYTGRMDHNVLNVGHIFSTANLVELTVDSSIHPVIIFNRNIPANTDTQMHTKASGLPRPTLAIHLAPIP